MSNADDLKQARSKSKTAVTTAGRRLTGAATRGSDIAILTNLMTELEKVFSDFCQVNEEYETLVSEEGMEDYRIVNGEDLATYASQVDITYQDAREMYKNAKQADESVKGQQVHATSTIATSVPMATTANPITTTTNLGVGSSLFWSGTNNMTPISTPVPYSMPLSTSNMPPNQSPASVSNYMPSTCTTTSNIGIPGGGMYLPGTPNMPSMTSTLPVSSVSYYIPSGTNTGNQYYTPSCQGPGFTPFYPHLTGNVAPSGPPVCLPTSIYHTVPPPPPPGSYGQGISTYPIQTAQTSWSPVYQST